MDEAVLNDTKLEKIEKETEKEVNTFLISLFGILSTIDSTSSYISAKNNIETKVLQFTSEFKNLLNNKLTSELKRLAPSMSQNQINLVIDNTYKQKFTLPNKQKITLDDIIFRRGQQMSSDITNTYLSKIGFNQGTQKQIRDVLKTTYEKNKSSFAKILSNETHKIQQTATIIQGGIDQRQNPNVKVTYTYVTVGDNRVRPSHQSLSGKEYTQEQLEKSGPPSELSEIGCRCQLVRN